ncbi:hypothetical protein AALO_G00227480 [Alosa alosa]|uniref:Uncharacterized protein n=1 Tax=Alosa alosa TaxID=278164 RepID=A0AAV6FZR9_9TELE|nr:hypothetical protein AALO_G00227480 [Alosa alosa]
MYIFRGGPYVRWVVWVGQRKSKAVARKPSRRETVPNKGGSTSLHPSDRYTPLLGHPGFIAYSESCTAGVDISPHEQGCSVDQHHHHQHQWAWSKGATLCLLRLTAKATASAPPRQREAGKETTWLRPTIAKVPRWEEC